MSVYREYSDSGELLLEGQYDSHGLKFGSWIEYSRYGAIVVEEYYLHGLRHGLYKSFYDNGVLWCSGWYKEGKKEGEFKIFDQFGNLKQIRLYYNDTFQKELDIPFSGK